MCIPVKTNLYYIANFNPGFNLFVTSYVELQNLNNLNFVLYTVLHGGNVMPFISIDSDKSYFSTKNACFGFIRSTSA